MTKPKFDKGYFICRACAKELGGKVSAGVATAASKTCGYCEGKKQQKAEKFILPYVDYDFPTDPRQTFLNRLRRD